MAIGLVKAYLLFVIIKIVIIAKKVQRGDESYFQYTIFFKHPFFPAQPGHD